MMENFPKLCGELEQDLNKNGINKKVEMHCEIFLLYTIVAAQDGLVEKEYQTIKNVAKKYLHP